jgi:hypothetical protein
MTKACLVTIIDCLLSLSHQCITLTTIKREENGSFSLIKKGVSQPRRNKYKPGCDLWDEFIQSWLLTMTSQDDILHYVCIRRFPKSSVWEEDEQEKRDVRNLKKSVSWHVKRFKPKKMIILDYNTNENFVELVQEFIDLKEMEHARLKHFIPK